MKNGRVEFFWFFTATCSKVDLWNYFLEWGEKILFWRCWTKKDPKWTKNEVFLKFFFVEKAVHKPLTLEQLKGLKLIQMILSDSFLVELEEVG